MTKIASAFVNGAKLLALCGVVAVTACSAPPQEAKAARTVETLLIGEASGEVSTTYSGQVVSRYSTDYGFRVGGMITAVPVEVGQRVSAGQVLARLDPQDMQVQLNSASAQSAAAAAQSQVQTTDLSRAQRLLNEGFISQAEFDRTQAATTSAQANLRSARAQQSGASQQLNYTVLRASRDGVVTAITGEVGEVVGAGHPVIMVESAGSLEVAISIPEGDMAALRGGQLQAKFWTSPSNVYPAKIRTLSMAANPQTRTFDARIAFDAPAGVAAIGGTAEVILGTSVAQKTISLPLSAITQQGEASVAWVVTGNPATVQPRVVQIHATQGNDYLISSGLKAGERVVSAGAHLLKAGEQVRATQTTRVTNQ